MALMIFTLAWCGITMSISEIDLMPFAIMPSMIACGMRVTACLKTFLPFITGYCLPASRSSGR